MADNILPQFIALAFFVLFMGFCFCDGFGLPTAGKLLFFGVFLGFCIYSLKTKAEFDLALILPLPLCLALLLCFYAKKRAERQRK